MTTADFARNPDNYCYRHPDRQSFVLCQRCLRTICPECQTQAAVGVICPECLRDQQNSATPAQKKAERRWNRSAGATSVAVRSGRPVVTYVLMALMALVFVLQLTVGNVIAGWLQFAGAYVIPDTGAPLQPWRVLSVLFVHGSFWHVGFNVLALWMIGRSLEPLLGRARFLALYLLSGVGGSVAVAFLTDPAQPVVGASGAIFGLFGAMLIIGRHLGANITSIAVIIGINFAFPFVQGLMAGSMSAVRISWEAHLGGLIAGALIGLIFARTRERRQQPLQFALLALVGVAMIVLFVVRALTYA